MLEINLLPVREARRRADVRQQVMQLVLGLIVTGAVIGLVHSNVLDQKANAELRVRQMEQDIKQFQPQIEQVAAFKKKKSELEKKIEVIDGLDKARSGPVRLLSELATRTPDRLWLTSLTTKGRTIKVKGESLDNELVAAFLGDLNSSQVFEEVDLDGTQISDSKTSGLKLVDFSITARLIGGGEPEAAPKKKKTKKTKQAEQGDEA
jgi:type IV pilus assembly protein PilN